MWSKALQNQIPESLVKNCRFLGTGLPYPPESHEEAQESAFITGVCMRWGGGGGEQGSCVLCCCPGGLCPLCRGVCVCQGVCQGRRGLG